jgi:endoribonuclease LACTB2
MEARAASALVASLGKREPHGEVERFHMTRRLPGAAPYWTSVYRLGDVLVDSGCSSGRAAFVRWLRERPVQVVLTTHEHEDHVGNHPVLPRDAIVWAPALAVRFLEHGHPRFPLYRRIVWGYHEKAPGARVVADKVDAAGRSFRIVRTDGHSEEHVAYLDERENALFSGDAYMGKFRAARVAEDLHTELASLRRMAELDPATLYPAHGPVLPRPRAKLLETVEHFEALWRRAWSMRERGMTTRRIARELLGGPSFLTLYSLGEFSEARLIENLLRRPLPP